MLMVRHVTSTMQPSLETWSFPSDKRVWGVGSQTKHSTWPRLVCVCVCVCVCSCHPLFMGSLFATDDLRLHMLRILIYHA